jgi:CRISPR-associated endonuclease/helicase Cas3
MTQGLADGIYIALPSMATANAMHQRLSKVYRQFFLPTSRPSLILAHGARHLSDTFQQSVRLSQHPIADNDYIEDKTDNGVI